MAWLFFPVFLAACGAAGATGALFSPGAWYRGLDKPAWTPPDRAFPVAWTLIYVAIAAAAARVAALPGSQWALALWALQIALNTLWTPVFFGLHRIRLGLVVLGALIVAVIVALPVFWRLDAVAGALLLPYLGWLGLAFALNLAILRRNPAG